MMAFQSAYCTKSQCFHCGFLQQIWLNLLKTPDFVIFAKEILIRKLQFLCTGKIPFYCARCNKMKIDCDFLLAFLNIILSNHADEKLRIKRNSYANYFG